MIRKILLGFGIAGICACVAILHVRSARAAVLEGYVPITMVGPATAHPGDTVTYTINSPGENDVPINVTISAAPAGSFSSLPSTVTIAPYERRTQFQATISWSAWGIIAVSAKSANTITTYTTVD